MTDTQRLAVHWLLLPLWLPLAVIIGAAVLLDEARRDRAQLDEDFEEETR